MSNSEPIEILLNGEPRRVPAGFSLERLLFFLEIDPARVAVERNREILRKTLWSTTQVESGDHIEVVWFVGGG